MQSRCAASWDGEGSECPCVWATQRADRQRVFGHGLIAEVRTKWKDSVNTYCETQATVHQPGKTLSLELEAAVYCDYTLGCLHLCQCCVLYHWPILSQWGQSKTPLLRGQLLPAAAEPPTCCLLAMLLTFSFHLICGEGLVLSCRITSSPSIFSPFRKCAFPSIETIQQFWECSLYVVF